MKLLFLILISSAAQADMQITAMREMFDRSKCIGASAIIYPTHYRVLKKIDAHHYELIGRFANTRIHALLETHTNFADASYLNMIRIKHTGTKQVELENGFTIEADLWKECNE